MTTRSGQWDLLPYEVPGKQAGVEADQRINPMPRPRAERSRQAGWLGGGGHPPGGAGMDAAPRRGDDQWCWLSARAARQRLSCVPPIQDLSIGACWRSMERVGDDPIMQHGEGWGTWGKEGTWLLVPVGVLHRVTGMACWAG